MLVSFAILRFDFYSCLRPALLFFCTCSNGYLEAVDILNSEYLVCLTGGELFKTSPTLLCFVFVNFLTGRAHVFDLAQMNLV